MSTVLQAIRWELQTLRLRVTCLEHAEVALGPLYEPMERLQPTRPRADRARRSSRRPGSRDVTCAQLREHVLSHAPISRRELIDALGISPAGLDKKLRRLVANGEIGVDGQRDKRLYRPPDTAVASPPAPAPSGLGASSGTAPARGVYPMYDTIVDLNGATTEQLMQRTELPTNLVVEQCRRLLQLGLVRFGKVGDARVWMPAKTKIVGDAQ